MTDPRRTAGELMRYFAVSVIALGVDMGCLLLASQFLHYLWAATIGFVLGAVVSYLLAIRWAFRHRRLAAFPRAEFAAYAAVGAVMGELAATVQRFAKVRNAALALRLGALLLLVWVGVMFSRRARADLAEQMRLREEITAAYEDMEARVRERTADLEKTTRRLAEENEERVRSDQRTRLILNSAGEGIFGVDLVREQIRVASGLPMSFTQDDLVINGHAIEVRINAERLPDFAPRPGKVKVFHAPGGLGVRMDSALYGGYSIPPYYDSLIGKLIVHGRDRPEALARLKRALSELIIDGIETTMPLFDALLEDGDIQTGDYNIHWLEKWLARKFGA